MYCKLDRKTLESSQLVPTISIFFDSMVHVLLILFENN
jgi:hypothetical protein